MNFNTNQNAKINQVKKYKKGIVIGILFLLILLITTYVVYSYYVKNVKQETLRNEFFEKAKNMDVSFFLNSEVYHKIAKRVKKENYESSFDIGLSTTMKDNMFSKLDLSKFEFHYNMTKDQDHKKSFGKLSTKYAGNDLFILDTVQNDKQIAFKSDEIVNKYVGIDKSNTQSMVDQLMEKQTDLSAIKRIKNFVLDREGISIENITKSSSIVQYANLLKENTSAEHFSKRENVVLTMDDEQITTTEYTVELTKEQVKNLLNGIAQKIENDPILEEFVVTNVQNFENDKNEILEYKDNENVIEISGEENNFNTYLNWSQVENTEATNTNETNVTLNQVEQNTVANTNTISNETENQNTTDLNQTPVQITEPNEEIPNPEENSNPQTEQAPSPQPATQEETQNTNNPPIVEDENLRTQGFIEINEEAENTEEETPFIIGENWEDTTKNIVKRSEKIDWLSYLLTLAKVNLTQEELLEQIQKLLTEGIKQNNSLRIKMYVNGDEIIKVNIEIPELTKSFDVEVVEKGEQEKYLNLTELTGKEDNASGHKISLYKKSTDAVLKTKVNIHKIYKNKIHQKWNIDLETKGTINAKKYITTANILYSDSNGEFKINGSNSLDFNIVPEITDLNDENCLFLDTIQNREELLLTRDAIKQKTIDVLKEKNRNLNMIDLNNENSIVQQNDLVSSEENTTAKTQAKQKLIQTISDKMKDYQDRGEKLKIEDLEGLQIPDCEVQISISSNLAIITVNGFKFKLDSDFNLSDSENS